MTSSGDCIVCFLPVPSDGKFLSCASCKLSYHLGQSCSGVSDGTFTAMGHAKRDKWKCRTCRSGDSRSGAVGGFSQDDNDGVAAQLAAINTKLQSLLSLKDSVDSLLSLPAKVDQLLELRPAVESLKGTVKEVESSIQFLSAKYDSVVATATANERTIHDLQSETTSLKETVSEQTRFIHSLQGELNDSEQYSRLSNLEVHGLPVIAREDLNATFSDLASKLGVPTPQAGDILAVHRLPARPGVTPVVLVRFSSVWLRDRWMNARSGLRSFGLDSGRLF